MSPGMCDTPISLNLHGRLRDSYIAVRMSSLRIKSGRQNDSCGCPPGLARRQIIGTGILGHNKRKAEGCCIVLCAAAFFVRRAANSGEMHSPPACTCIQKNKPHIGRLHGFNFVHIIPAWFEPLFHILKCKT